MDAFDVLLKAQELIRSPEHWCQGTLGRDADGRDMWPTKPTRFDPDLLDAAFSRCAVGAVLTVRHEDLTHMMSEGPDDVRDALTFVAHEMGYNGTALLNDQANHEAVMEMFDRAREIVADGS